MNNKIQTNEQQKLTTTIAVTHDTRDNLSKLGKKGESFNSIIIRVMDALKDKTKAELMGGP